MSDAKKEAPEPTNAGPGREAGWLVLARQEEPWERKALRLLLARCVLTLTVELQDVARLP